MKKNRWSSFFMAVFQVLLLTPVLQGYFLKNKILINKNINEKFSNMKEGSGRGFKKHKIWVYMW